MNRWIPIILLAGLLFLTGYGRQFPTGPAALAASKTPEEFQKGETTFNRYCAACHGLAAAGTDHGPTFIDRIYQPSHHADQSFILAPRMGARAHHWNYGDMPKIEGVTDDDLNRIIGYIRWLQRQAGIK